MSTKPEPTRRDKTRAAQPAALTALGSRLAGVRGRLAQISLANYLRALVLLAVALASSSAAIYAFNTQYRKSLLDTWAIIYLNNERLTDALAARLRVLPQQQKTAGESGGKWRTPAFVHRVDDGGERTRPVEGRSVRRALKAADFGAKSISRAVSGQVHPIGSYAYLVIVERAERLRTLLDGAYPDGDYLIGWRADIRQSFARPADGSAAPDDDSTRYVATLDGRLVYTSDAQITPETYLARSLVQRFVAGTLASAQIEMDSEDHDGEAIFGYYRQVPGTNLVMFSELSKAKALAGTFALARQFALVLLGIVVLAVLLLQLPLSGVVKPLQELAVLSEQVSRGQFNVKPRAQGIGELLQLTRSFTTMAQNLVARDKAIQSLMVHQQDKIRMERELAVAHSVQDNFLPKEPLARASGLELAAIYAPAAKVAGDWFSYHYDAERDTTLVVIADISGHDMAASMFTAIIAGTFEQLIDERGLGVPLEEMAERINRQIIRFGKRKWHATVQMLRYARATGELEIVNCGHCFPVIFAPPAKERGKEARGRVVRLPSQPLGWADECEIQSKTERLAPGETILLYTDGLSETRNPNGTVYGLKRIVAQGGRSVRLPPQSMLQELRVDAERFRKQSQASDDLCLLAVRAIAS